MQAGACTTAFNAIGETIALTEKEGVKSGFSDSNLDNFPLSYRGSGTEKIGNFEVENLTEKEGTNTENLTEKYDVKPTKPPRKRAKGTGDTETTGKHSTRFRAYCNAVKKRLVNPTIYALVRYPIDGKKIGSDTAKEFLSAMEKEGVVQRTEKGGKTAWARCA